MIGASRSLLTYIDAPVVVGDRDGRAAYVNPAFESSFSVGLESVVGQTLATLFEGGARESVLSSVAEACDQGKTVRFRIRQGGKGFGAIASPIVAEDSRVGVVLLLVESAATDERFLALYREISEPLGGLAQLLDEMLEQTGGRRSERYRSLIEEGIRALTRIRKWTEELRRLYSGTVASEAIAGRVDPVPVLRDTAARVKSEFANKGVAFELLVPAQLPAVHGDAGRLELALTHLLRDRLARAAKSSTITMAARTAGRGTVESVVISIVDAGDEGCDPAAAADAAGAPEPRIVPELLSEIGAEVRTTAAPRGGRTTAIRLSVV
ncbi:MAG: PAS domain-containing protein [Myxococcales bacterium]|nr:PAS domain-containing protein [Myxococcales bacterium]